jgi:hypothetical protein
VEIHLELFYSILNICSKKKPKRAEARRLVQMPEGTGPILPPHTLYKNTREGKIEAFHRLSIVEPSRVEYGTMIRPLYLEDLQNIQLR